MTNKEMIKQIDKAIIEIGMNIASVEFDKSLQESNPEACEVLEHLKDTLLNYKTAVKSLRFQKKMLEPSMYMVHEGGLMLREAPDRCQQSRGCCASMVNQALKELETEEGE